MTAQVVDVESRLRSARASSDRLRALLGEARSTTDVVAIEGELSKREAESEALQGRLRVLNDQVELATIDAWLTERGDVRVSDNLPGFRGGLQSGWVTLVTVSRVALAMVGFLLPFVPFVALAVWLIRRYRARRRNRPLPAPPAGMAPMPAPPVPPLPMPAPPMPTPKEPR